MIKNYVKVLFLYMIILINFIRLIIKKENYIMGMVKWNVLKVIIK